MAKEICISSTPHETRLAILEDDQLAEIYYERENEYTLAGSIYNGRVTRVLPGMQSAFVDLGLERDAFLYVTDFMELEDQEETDELEKAAASGAGQAPREVRHPQGFDPNGQQERAVDDRGNGERVKDERGAAERGSRSGQRRPEPRQDRPATQELTVEPAAPEQTAAGQAGAQEQEGPGGRRWRGRRRRRGGRGQEMAPEGIPETQSGETERDDAAEFEESAPAHEARAERPASHAEPAAFVLPGESLSKYGSTAASETPKEVAEPVAPRYTSRPSTLIEAPITWDGSGLLPGESISRHRERPPEATEEGGAEVPADDAAPPEAGAAARETIEEFEEIEAPHEALTKEPAHPIPSSSPSSRPAPHWRPANVSGRAWRPDCRSRG